MTIQELARNPETMASDRLSKLSEAVVHKSLKELCQECEGSTDNQLLLGLLEYIDESERFTNAPKPELRSALGAIAVSADTINDFKTQLSKDTLIDADELITAGNDRAINVMGSVLRISYSSNTDLSQHRMQYLRNIRHSAKAALQ